MRAIDNVTDDEIVDSIAKRGQLGVNLEHPWKDKDYRSICKDLAIIGDGMREDSKDRAESEIGSRIDAIVRNNRLMILGDTWLFLTPEEWGRRLAGKTSEEIAKALEGE